MTTELTAERLRELLVYEPSTGAFTWRIRRAGNAMAGSPAGHLTVRGYISIGINGRRYLAHRLAWLYIHGVLPKSEIDHINRIPSDNRIANLREANRSENMQNTRMLSNNTSGFRGVFWDKHRSRWRARICLNNQVCHIGIFASVEEARDAYESAAAALHARRAEANP